MQGTIVFWLTFRSRQEEVHAKSGAPCRAHKFPQATAVAKRSYGIAENRRLNSLLLNQLLDEAACSAPESIRPALKRLCLKREEIMTTKCISNVLLQGLYCVWIMIGNPCRRLACVWIDPQMRSYESDVSCQHRWDRNAL